MHWILSLVCFAAEPAPVANEAGLRFFESKIRPVLVKHCYGCHSAEAKKSRGGLVVDTRDGLLKGGDAGPAIVPGKPLESLLVKVLHHDGLAMPPKDKLSPDIIADFETWVKMGAPDPRDGKAAVVTKTIDIQAGKKFWSFQPLQRVATPLVRQNDWAQTNADAFILSALENRGLQPVRQADPATWLRRVCFDLTGLPPTPEELDAFLADSRPDARERVVDRLLGSPAFGERWGRHWLDVARYADSNGKDENLTFHEAYLYRDYVIGAFNADHRYDDLLREQIAGDLLPASSEAQRERQLIGSGFLILGPKVLANRDKEGRRLDVIDEQIDTIGRTVLGLSLGCARCHDHKFDPIPTADYYALAGIFSSTRTLNSFKLGNPVVSGWMLRPLSPEDEKRDAARQAHAAELKKVGDQLKKAKADLAAAEAGTPVLPTRLAGIVVDDPEAKRQGEWKESTFTKPYVGKGYLHDDRTGKGMKSVTFSVDLVQPGSYEVFVSYTTGNGRATNVPVTIQHADGSKTVKVDQTKKPNLEGLFQSVGTFRFEKSAKVTISNAGTVGHVIVDAVRLIPPGQPQKAEAPAGNKGLSPEQQARLEAARKLVADLEKREAQLKKGMPPAPRLVMAPQDEEKPTDLRIHIRGSHETLGPSVPRGTLQVVSWGEPLHITQGSGRRELAQWLVDPRNPLTARVYVNRIWKHLFGEGLVRSVDDFGIQGEPPSHPELLDTLALEFMENGWSTKHLIRKLVLSKTYGLASITEPAAEQADPENRLLWRANRRRLEAEPLRDAILALAGNLNRSMGGPVVSHLPERAITNESRGGIDTETNVRRSVYLPIIRNGLPGIFEVFDFADPDVAIGRRDTTTVATQALYLLNSRFVIAQARAAADRLLPLGDDHSRVRYLYRAALGRSPTDPEIKETLAFVSEFKADLGDKPGSEREAWAALVQAIVGCTEFRFVE
jgi:cytochrome c553